MNKKDRIIELVKQNVISMEDALDLLEASQDDSLNSSEESVQDNKDQQFDVNSVFENVMGQGKQIAKEMNDYFKKDTEEINEEDIPNENISDEELLRLEEIEAEIKELKAQVETQEEAITICQQRLREIEIFAELDELTEEMSQEQEKLQAKRTDLETKQQASEEKLMKLRAERKALKRASDLKSKQEFKEFINESTGKFTEKASQFSEEAVKEGKKFGSKFASWTRDFTDNFKRKDVQLDVSFPWLKSVEETYTESFPAEAVNSFNIEILNGSVVVELHEAEDIELIANAKLFGKEGQDHPIFFKEMSLFQVDGEDFILHAKDKKLAVDVHLKVPGKVYESLSIKTTNGDINLKDLESQEWDLELLNGDLTLEGLEGQDAHIESVNGNADIKETSIETIVYSNLNGDFRISGPVGNLDLDLVNANVYITKMDTEASNLQVETLNGFIKLSVPQESNLDITASSLRAKIEDRLEQVDVVSSDNNRHKEFNRTINSDSSLIQADLETKQGAIYLKDN